MQWSHVLAITLVFSGVWLVTKSRARADNDKKSSNDCNNLIIQTLMGSGGNGRDKNFSSTGFPD